jgi:hypothetical protein
MLAVAGVAVLLAGAAVVNSRRAADNKLGHAPVVPAPAPTASTSLTTPASLLCDDWPGQGMTEDAHVPFSVGTHHGLFVVALRCTDTAGERHASLVRVVDSDDDRRVVATLIRPQQDLHVASVSVTAGTITVSAADDSPIQPGDQRSAADFGSVLNWTFHTSTGTTYTADRPRRVAAACSPSDIGYTVQAGRPTKSGAAGGKAAASSLLLHLRNTGGAPCAIEGYPTVRAITDTGGGLPAHAALFGPAGGVLSDSAPPVVVLASNATATAVVDSYPESASGGATICSTLTRLQIGLPTGEQLGTSPIALYVCDFQVHPLVPGTTGTMA